MKTYPGSIRSISFAALLAAGIAWIWLSRSDIPVSSNIQAPQAGFLAPDLSLENQDSTTVSLSDLEGRPVILNFWASWCPPCRAEMPDFQQASLEYADSELLIIGVNATSQDAMTDVRSFISDYGLTFPILMDKNGEAARTYQVHSLPTTFFIGADGTIQKVVIGGPLPLPYLRIEADQLIRGDE